MMGVGFSTIGKMLSRKLKSRFIDIDLLIEKEEKKNKRDIWKRSKNYFRKIEKKVTLDVLKRKLGHCSWWGSICKFFN